MDLDNVFTRMATIHNDYFANVTVFGQETTVMRDKFTMIRFGQKMMTIRND